MYWSEEVTARLHYKHTCILTPHLVHTFIYICIHLHIKELETHVIIIHMYTCKLIIYKNTFISDEPSCVVLVRQYIIYTRQQVLLRFWRSLNGFSRILQHMILKTYLTSGLQKYRKAIIKVLSKKKKTTFLKEIEDASVHYRTESQRNCK